MLKLSTDLLDLFLRLNSLLASLPQLHVLHGLPAATGQRFCDQGSTLLIAVFFLVLLGSESVGYEVALR